MNIPMAAAMKVMVDPSLGLRDATDKKMATATATTTMTILNQNDQSTVAVVGGGNRRNTINPLVAVGEVGHAQRVTIKLAVMICGDRIVLGLGLLG